MQEVVTMHMTGVTLTLLASWSMLVPNFLEWQTLYREDPGTMGEL
jgi:hypothetical protein